MAAGIPKGNCYYHYKAKDELLADVLARRIDGIREQLAGWERASDAPSERLRMFIAMVRDSADQLRWCSVVGS